MAESDLGSDFAGVTDISPAWGQASGRRALAEAVARRLVTPRGLYADYPDYGFDASSLIGTALTDSKIKQRVSEQAFLEEEIQNCVVTVIRVGEALTITLRLTDGDGPFDLTLSVSSLGVEAIVPKAA